MITEKDFIDAIYNNIDTGFEGSIEGRQEAARECWKLGLKMAIEALKKAKQLLPENMIYEDHRYHI